MAKTLLDGVNEVLKRVQIIKGDTTALTNLTNSALQNYIDIAIQIWNETIDRMYAESKIPMPNELAEDTITLVLDQRDYTINSTMNQLHFPLVDEVNGTYISEYPGGYLQIVKDQPIPSNHTGQPVAAAIRPTDGKLYIDVDPTSDQAGRVYKYRYDKDLMLENPTDQFPFKDVVFRALVPAVAEMWKANLQKQFDIGIFNRNMGTAIKYLTQTQSRDRWTPLRRVKENETDPLNAS